MLKHTPSMLVSSRWLAPEASQHFRRAMGNTGSRGGPGWYPSIWSDLVKASIPCTLWVAHITIQDKRKRRTSVIATREGIPAPLSIIAPTVHLPPFAKGGRIRRSAEGAKAFHNCVYVTLSRARIYRPIAGNLLTPRAVPDRRRWSVPINPPASFISASALSPGFTTNCPALRDVAWERGATTICLYATPAAEGSAKLLRLSSDVALIG